MIELALFGKGKTKDKGTAQPTSASPLPQVISMKQQGYDDSQISQYLQSQGFSQQQISDVLSQASLGSTQPSYDEYGAMPPPGPGPEMPPPQGYEQYPQYPEQPAEPTVDKEKIEEIAEAIIDEKWNEVLKDINKVIEWKNNAESRLVKIEQEIKNIKENFDSLHKGVLGKISDYDQNLSSVGTEIKAMEKVFQKILPTFTENVNKLAKLSEGVKLPKKK